MKTFKQKIRKLRSARVLLMLCGCAWLSACHFDSLSSYEEFVPSAEPITIVNVSEQYPRNALSIVSPDQIQVQDLQDSDFRRNEWGVSFKDLSEEQFLALKELYSGFSSHKSGCG